MRKKTGSLIFKFAIIFIIFTVIAISLSAVITYIHQNDIYHKQCEERLHNISEYLEDLMVNDGEEFIAYQEYMIENSDKVLLPMDFDSYLPAKREFERLFSEKYPGRTLFEDIEFDEISEDVQLAFAIYKHEYWLLTYEDARSALDVIYTYYVVPTGEDRNVYYFIDAVREPKEVDGKEYINLLDDVPQFIETHAVMWEAWDTGKNPTGYDTYDNKYGKTYAYYSPLFIDSRKVGIVCVEVEIEDVNEAILNNTINLIIQMAIIISVMVIGLLYYINKKYISKLSHLRNNVGSYANEKNADIAVEIEKEASGADEIAALSTQVAAMIMELDNYMKTLVSTTKELTDQKARADEMDMLATRDALTGIRNKTSYDKEVQRIEWEMANGDKEFGVAMIDLNFLKRINDTYGHEQGNVAIKKLCNMVCNLFKHSPVFRIGGDEFAVILENEDYNCCDALVAEFNDEIEHSSRNENLEQWERISAAIGVAKYDPSIDNSYDNVFKRADKAMYVRKRQMKAVRTG